MSDKKAKPAAPPSSGFNRDQAIDLLTTGKYSDFSIHCESTTFKFHKFMLSANCDFFKAAIDGGFKEGLDNEITIRETTPWAVAVAINHIYTADTEVPYSLHKIWPHLPDFESMSEIEKLERSVDVYILTDRFMLDSLNEGLANHIFEMVTDTDGKEWDSHVEFILNGAK